MVEERSLTPEAVRQPPFRHIIEAQQFTRPWLEDELFPLSDLMGTVARNGGDSSLAGKRLYNLFYEPSTRTRTSFESAMQLLGGTASGTENARAFSSAIKGETLEDTVRILNGFFYNAIVLRYDEEGGAARAASVSRAPLINAGDGPGQHPTQALLDVYTIRRFLGSLDGVRIAMVGDLAYGRTTHSLAYLMSRFKDVKMYFVSPDALRMKPGILNYLSEQKVKFRELVDLAEVVDEVDVVYTTRPQKERFQHAEQFGPSPSSYVLTPEIMETLPQRAIVMHPLPRNEELPDSVINDPRVVVFDQAQNGLYVRMALLRMLLRPDLG